MQVDSSHCRIRSAVPTGTVDLPTMRSSGPTNGTSASMTEWTWLRSASSESAS